jgi:hypothetical protein
MSLSLFCKSSIRRFFFFLIPSSLLENGYEMVCVGELSYFETIMHLPFHSLSSIPSCVFLGCSCKGSMQTPQERTCSLTRRRLVRIHGCERREFFVILKLLLWWLSWCRVWIRGSADGTEGIISLSKSFFHTRIPMLCVLAYFITIFSLPCVCVKNLTIEQAETLIVNTLKQVMEEKLTSSNVEV